MRRRRPGRARSRSAAGAVRRRVARLPRGPAGRGAPIRGEAVRPRCPWAPPGTAEAVRRASDRALRASWARTSNEKTSTAPRTTATLASPWTSADTAALRSSSSVAETPARGRSAGRGQRARTTATSVSATFCALARASTGAGPGTLGGGATGAGEHAGSPKARAVATLAAPRSRWATERNGGVTHSPIDLHDDPLVALPVEFGVKHPLPRAEVEPPFGDRNDDLVVDEERLEVRVSVVFSRPMVL